MKDKQTNLKEKLIQALTSTIKVISDDYKPSFDKKSKNLKDYNFFELDNLNSRSDFIKFRAEADSEALKKKNFLIKKFIKNIYPITHLANLYMILQKKSDMKF